MFTKENTDHFPTVKQQFYGYEHEQLCTFDITSDIVRRKVQKLKMNKAPGIDSVGTNTLLELLEETVDYIAELFNKSLNSGDIPPDRKLANVTAIFKKGNKSSTSNYRPVSLTVNLCKVFESIMGITSLIILRNINLSENLNMGLLGINLV